MKHFDAPRAVALGAALLIAVNALVLGMAWWNRSGEPDARLELTERELAMPQFRDKDDTGLILTLALADRLPAGVIRRAWLANRELPPFQHAWLDRAKLQSLGFDFEAIEAAARDPREGGGTGRSVRAACVVLEFEGEAWRAWLAAREADVVKLRSDVERGLADRGKLVEAEALLAIDRISRSRLMPVDAGLDPAALRARHPDRSLCAIVPAFVAVRASVAEGGTVTCHGTIERLAVDGIAVPWHWLAPLEPFIPHTTALDLNQRTREDLAASRWPAASPPRYRATLAYGRGLDPWLAGVAPIDSESR